MPCCLDHIEDTQAVERELSVLVSKWYSSVRPSPVLTGFEQHRLMKVAPYDPGTWIHF